MPKILGIDPGTGIVGFGCIEADNRSMKMIDAGVIRTPAHQAAELRLLTIYNEVNQLINDFRPDCLSIEKLFFARNVTTAMTVSQSRGVVLLAAIQSHLQISEYTPPQRFIKTVTAFFDSKILNGYFGGYKEVLSIYTRGFYRLSQ